MSTALPPRPSDATLSVTKAARLLGVHPNTVRAWSDAGRLRYYRINPRGDRRYRLGDLQRFLAAAEIGATDGGTPPSFERGSGHERSGRRREAPSPHRAGTHWSDGAAHAQDLIVLDRLTRLAGRGEDLDEDLASAVDLIRAGYDHRLVAIWSVRRGRLVPLADAHAPGSGPTRLVDLPLTYGVLGAALEAPDGVATTVDPGTTHAILPDGHVEVAAVIPGRDGPWGVLHLVTDADPGRETPSAGAPAILAATVGTLVAVAERRVEVERLLHRAEALRRVASDIGSHLDLDRILSGLVDHAMVLFEGDRAAVYVRRRDGQTVAEVSRGLSSSYLASNRDLPAGSLSAAAIASREPLFANGYRDDPRGRDVRAAVVQEGFDTLCTAPLLDGTEILGVLDIYHDEPHAVDRR